MKKGIFRLSLLAFLLPSLLRGQEADSLYRLIKQLPEPAQWITTDPLQQCYLVTPRNELIQYDASGQELFRFSNNQLGELTYIDATNPFNLILYYPRFRTVITLDRALNQTGEYNLSRFDLIEVNAIATSNDNHIWLYDDVAFKLKKIDQQGNLLASSDHLGLLLDRSIAPNFLLQRDNALYLNVPDTGILVFDLFGFYQKTIPIKGLSGFQLFNDQLLFREGEKLMAYQLKSFSTQEILIPAAVSGASQIRIEKNRLFALKDGFVRVYGF